MLILDLKAMSSCKQHSNTVGVLDATLVFVMWCLPLLNQALYDNIFKRFLYNRTIQVSFGKVGFFDLKAMY